MWLYLENESLIFIEAIVYGLFFFIFQILMCAKAKRVALRLLPIYVFVPFSVLLLAFPFIITESIRGNWGLIVASLFNLAELAFIALFIGLAWIAYAIIRAFKRS